MHAAGQSPSVPSQRIEYMLADEVSSAQRGVPLPHAAPPSPDYTKQVRRAQAIVYAIPGADIGPPRQMHAAESGCWL